MTIPDNPAPNSCCKSPRTGASRYHPADIDTAADIQIDKAEIPAVGQEIIYPPFNLRIIRPARDGSWHVNCGTSGEWIDDG